jgi:hypothetical protein
MRRATDGLHLHPVPVLSIPRGPAGLALFVCHRHVVAGLHRGRALLGTAALPRIVRVQPDC